MEITGYNANVDAQLEDCPFEWWLNCGNMMYPNLGHIAKNYLSVPAIIQAHTGTLQQKLYFSRNRKMLSGSMVDTSIWLHSNRQTVLKCG